MYTLKTCIIYSIIGKTCPVIINYMRHFLFFVLLLPAANIRAQLANSYPQDIGIENDPNVLYVEKFDDDLVNVFSRYNDKKNTAGMSQDGDVPPGSPGPYSLKMTNTGGANTGGHLYKRFSPGWDSTVYVRYYVKYPSVSQGYIHHESVWAGGYNPATPWPNPQAGTCGLGDSRISIAYEPISQSAMNTYLYWGEMHNDPNGNCWGNVMIKGDLVPAAIPFDQWLCVEMMIKLNNPVSASNGELRIWHDGQEVGYWGPGFPNGNWVWDKFIVNPADPPFPGFRWRTDPGLNLNYIWIEYYDDQSPPNVSHYIKYDHLVIAKKPIGPIFVPTDTGIPQSDLPEVRLYPNPLQGGRVYLELPDAKAAERVQIALFSTEGRLLAETTRTGSGELSLPALPAGVYLLRIKGDQWSGVKKLFTSQWGN